MRNACLCVAALLAGTAYAQAPDGAGKDFGLKVVQGGVYEETRQGDMVADLSLTLGDDVLKIKAKAKWDRATIVELQQVNALPHPEVWKARRLVKKDATTWSVEGKPDEIEESPLTGRAFSIAKKGEGVFERAGEGCELDPAALEDESIPFLMESALGPEKPVGLNQPWTPSGVAMFQWLKEHGVLAKTQSGTCSATSDRAALGGAPGTDTCFALDIEAKGKQFSRNLVRGPMDATVRVKGTLLRSGIDGCFSEINLTIESTIAGDGKLPDGREYHIEGKLMWTLKGGAKKSAQKFVLPAKDAKVPIAFRVAAGRRESRTRTTTVGTKISGGPDDDFVKESATWTDETKDVDRGIATNVARRYANRKTIKVRDGKEETHPHPLSGKDVLLQTAFGTVFPSCADSTVPQDDVEAESLHDDALWLVHSSKSRGAGETWKPRVGDAAGWVVSWLGMSPETSDLKCTLKEIATADGEKVAKVEVSGTLTTKDARAEGKGTIKATIVVGLATGIVQSESVEADIAIRSVKGGEFSMKVKVEATSKAEPAPK